MNRSSKNTVNALLEWLHKETTESKVYVVSLIMSLVFKCGFEIFLAPLVCLNFQVRSQGIL
jgi:hypothetical protein